MKSIEQKILQDLLRELRVSAKLTQVDFSQKLNKPQSYISKYESGEKTLDYLEIRNICKVLDINMSDFTILYEEKLNES